MIALAILLIGVLAVGDTVRNGTWHGQPPGAAAVSVEATGSTSETVGASRLRLRSGGLMGARRFWDPHWSQAATAAVPDGTITLNDYRALDLTRPLTDPPIGHDQTRRLANAAASAAATERDGYDLSNRNPATRQPDVAANERNRKRRQRTSIPGDTPAVRRHTA